MTTTKELIDDIQELIIELKVGYDDDWKALQEKIDGLRHLRAVCSGCGKGTDCPAECIEDDKPITYWCEDCLIPMIERREAEE